MKKYVVGAAVTLVYIAYSFGIRNNHSKPVIAPTLPTKTNNQQASTGGGSSTQSTGSSTASSGSASAPSNQTKAAAYKDGSYTGPVVNVYYGNVQVAATVSGGKITGVKFLQYPHDNPNSTYINSQARPYLKQETLAAQSAHVNIITGATFTSEGFIQSLTSALSKAN